MDLYPLTFSEFLLAMDKEQLNDLIRNQEFDLATPFRDMYADLLKQYYYVGGMPEVVASYTVHQDFNEARIIQKRILDAYEQDFSKHAPYNLVPRLRMVWNSIPSQLAKENKKFVYGLIREGARAKEYEMALLWLFDSGLAHRVYRVDTPKLPLLAYEDLRAFKLFLVDVGLLSCMLQIDPRLYFAKNELFIECKGALTEQYVLQQLKTSTKKGIFYWANPRGTAEVDFLLDAGTTILPIEVKAGINLKSKSLKAFYEKYHPTLSIRYSMSDYKQQDWLLNIPLWAVETIDKHTW